ncbi:glycosyltransferase [Butyrivibrio sp. AE2032]|uniref:glycosyltransferase n=1 Tax=Butyrivibrio sp. AE2032 TaxID=1458463 RepID=UPI0006895520|nr:glycosyltransferase [Butyrivibrio sp. AE2032]
MTESSFQNLIRGKNVVFITVKNSSYIRVTQIKRILEKEASSVRVYSSEKGNPLKRAMELRKRMDEIDFSGVDVVVAGFLPQLLWGKLLKAVGRTGVAGANGGVAAGGVRTVDAGCLEVEASNDQKKPVLVADMFLSLYDTVILDRKLFRDGWWVADYLRKLDKQVIESADLVLTDTSANAEFLTSLCGAKKEKFETLYLEADEGIYKAKCLGESVPSDDKIYNVLYFGTGLPLQGTDVVLEAFNLVAGDGVYAGHEDDDFETDSSASHIGRDIVCTFVGGPRGIPSKVIKEAADNPNVRLIKWLSQERLAKKIEEADLCIAGHFNLYIDKAARTIPGKAFIYDAMNKPMILGDTRANRELFSEDANHIFVKRGDPKALAEAILAASISSHQHITT